MVNSTANVVRIRTTHDGCGPVEGIITGTGRTPELALAAVQRAAEKLAQEKSEEFARSIVGIMRNMSGQAQDLFEVVDVRITAGAMEGEGSGWLAYGTLARIYQP
jgi:hypothetical protein